MISHSSISSVACAVLAIIKALVFCMAVALTGEAGIHILASILQYNSQVVGSFLMYSSASCIASRLVLYFGNSLMS